MRVALLSDVHANLEALEACLAHAREAAQLAFLGDLVGYGADATAVIDVDPPFPLMVKMPGVGRGEPPLGVVSFEIEQTILPRLSGPFVPQLVAVGDARRRGDCRDSDRK